jgi:hypothetical protein
MGAIEGITVRTDAIAIAAAAGLLRVATGAQALELAVQELIPIAFVVDNVICDRRRRNKSLLEACAAHWLGAELALRDTAPALEGIPITEGHCIGGIEGAAGH